MPYEIVYTKNPNGVTTYFTGVLTDQEIIQSCEDRISSEEKVRDILFIMDDFLGVTEFRVSSETIRTCASYAVRASEINTRLVHVTIAPSDLLYGMSRMWQALSDGTNWNRNVFRNREEAEKWLDTNIA